MLSELATVDHCTIAGPSFSLPLSLKRAYFLSFSALHFYVSSSPPAPTLLRLLCVAIVCTEKYITKGK